MDSLPALLAATVKRYPGACAVMYRGRSISYQELWVQVQALVVQLHMRGLQRGERVALLQDNSPEYIAGYYGVLAAAGVVVPLNPAARARELAQLIAHSGARCLIADPQHPELEETRRRCGSALQVLESDAVAQHMAEVSAIGAELLSPGQLAAIHYTSGTTGRPKGVMLSHGNLVSNTLAIVQYLALGPADRGLNVLPFQYAYGNSILHSHLAAGACLVLEDGLVYPHRVLATMEAERVTGFFGVPATYALLLQRTRPQNYRLDALRYLTQAGGPMPPAQVRRVRQLFPRAEFFVMYGQTEATARVTYLPPALLDAKPASVGIAIANTEISVRSDSGEPLPAGQVGEVWVRGPGVMQGYWRDPVATADVLVDDWLRTGDLGRLDADGCLTLEGRASEMIKTGAYRVAPREIEEIVAELDGVQEVVAIGVPDMLVGEAIKLVIVKSPHSTLDALTVRAHCRRYLPGYKVPRYIEFAAALPRTGSGKVQRYRLAVCALPGAPVTNEHAEPVAPPSAQSLGRRP